MDATDSLLIRFARKHAIDLTNLLDAERDEVCWIVRCQDALDNEYASLSENTLASDQAVGVLWHLLARCAEMAEGAIVAFATASGAAAEVLSRATIERAVSIRFIILRPQARLAAYFRHHIEDVDRQNRQWQSLALSLTGTERDIHAAACEHRVRANEHMRGFVDRLEREILGSNPREQWPSKIADRFAGLEDSATYRTVYARLCSETHFDAEETLRYILAKVGGDALMRRMALETIGFTRLVIAIAVAYHLRALWDYADRYKMVNAALECSKGVARIERWSEQLSEHVGGI